jgi:hypothetical protein
MDFPRMMYFSPGLHHLDMAGVTFNFEVVMTKDDAEQRSEFGWGYTTQEAAAVAAARNAPEPDGGEGVDDETPPSAEVAQPARRGRPPGKRA